MEPDIQHGSSPQESDMPTSDADAVPPRGSLREPIAVGLVLVGLLIAGTIWIKNGSKRDPDTSSKRVYAQYTGDRSCRECHAGITAQHARSGHSRTLRLASETPQAVLLNGRVGEDLENPGATFSYQFHDGRLTTTRHAAGSEPEELLLQYALGSGQHALTFLTLTDGHSAASGALESRLTLFADGSTGRLAVTPGQDAPSNVKREVKTPQGRVLSVDETRKCLDCHTTVLSRKGPTEVDSSTLIPNVSCERCHGPGKAHIEAARRGGSLLVMPFGAGRETADLEMRLCGHCHRLPEMAPPGAVRTDNAELTRFQPVSLMQSKCFKGSPGKLRCTTCHDPHTKPSTDEARYEADCLKCHTAPAKQACTLSPSPRTGCIGCHMPKRDAGQGILFTDHWIRVQDRAP